MKPAPSEEFVLHCDVIGCEAQLSMVAGVSRKEHDWGRVSVYHDPEERPVIDVTDYDLCAEHYRKVMAVLGSVYSTTDSLRHHLQKGYE